MNARVVPPGLTSFLAGVPRTSSWAKFFAVPFGTQMLGALAFGSLAGLKPGLYINLFGMTATENRKADSSHRQKAAGSE